MTRTNDEIRYLATAIESTGPVLLAEVEQALEAGIASAFRAVEDGDLLAERIFRVDADTALEFKEPGFLTGWLRQHARSLSVPRIEVTPYSSEELKGLYRKAEPPAPKQVQPEQQSTSAQTETVARLTLDEARRMFGHTGQVASVVELVGRRPYTVDGVPTFGQHSIAKRCGISMEQARKLDADLLQLLEIEERAEAERAAERKALRRKRAQLLAEIDSELRR